MQSSQKYDHFYENDFEPSVKTLSNHKIFSKSMLRKSKKANQKILSLRQKLSIKFETFIIKTKRKAQLSVQSATTNHCHRWSELFNFNGSFLISSLNSHLTQLWKVYYIESYFGNNWNYRNAIRKFEKNIWCRKIVIKSLHIVYDGEIERNCIYYW